jgi:hypothetical protein
MGPTWSQGVGDHVTNTNPKESCDPPQRIGVSLTRTRNIINRNNEIFNSYFKKIILNETNIKYLYKFKPKSRI